MMRWSLILILLAPLKAISALFLEPGVGMFFDRSSFNASDEKQYDHEGSGAGGEVLARAGIGIGGLRLGVVGSYSKISERHRRKEVSDKYFPDVSTYSNTFEQRLFGWHAALFESKSGARIFGEGYTTVHRKSTYWDADKTSPFKKHDEQDGYGYGVGVGYYRLFAAATVMYRNLRFNEWDFKDYESRSEIKIQNFSRQQVHEFIFQISFPFDTGGSKGSGSGAVAGAVSKKTSGDSVGKAIGDLIKKAIDRKTSR